MEFLPAVYFIFLGRFAGSHVTGFPVCGGSCGMRERSGHVKCSEDFGLHTI